jgi:serine/threonine protein kinase
MQERPKTKQTSPTGEIKKLGRYQIIDKVGQGGMGSVFKAYDTKLERIVALKTLSPSIAAEESAVARFEREAKANAKLRHPNIVVLHDFEEVAGIYFLTMDFIEGGSLKSLLEKEWLSFGTSCQLMLQIAGAIGYAHTQGVIHRDIKPANILVNQEGKAVVTDFGLAKIINETTKISQTGAIMGTPVYMSPEQAAGSPDDPVDTRSDIYSLGTVFYEMLTGKPPFEGDTNIHIMHKILYEEIKSPREVNPKIPMILDAVCKKALAKKKEIRYQTAVEMSGAIEQYLKSKTREAAAIQEGHAKVIPITKQHAPIKARDTATAQKPAGARPGEMTTRESPKKTKPSVPRVLQDKKICQKATLYPAVFVLLGIFCIAGILWKFSSRPSEPEPEQETTKPVEAVPATPVTQKQDYTNESVAKWAKIDALSAEQTHQKLALVEEFLKNPHYPNTPCFAKAAALRESLVIRIKEEEANNIKEEEARNIHERLVRDAAGPVQRWDALRQFPVKYADTHAGRKVAEEMTKIERGAIERLQEKADTLERMVKTRDFSDMPHFEDMADSALAPLLARMGEKVPNVLVLVERLRTLYENAKAMQEAIPREGGEPERPERPERPEAGPFEHRAREGGEPERPEAGPFEHRPETEPARRHLPEDVQAWLQEYHELIDNELFDLIGKKHFPEACERVEQLLIKSRNFDNLPEVKVLEKRLKETKEVKDFFFSILRIIQEKGQAVSIGNVKGRLVEVEERLVSLQVADRQRCVVVPIDRVSTKDLLKGIALPEKEGKHVLYLCGLLLGCEGEWELSKKYLAECASLGFPAVSELRQRFAERRKKGNAEAYPKDSPQQPERPSGKESSGSWEAKAFDLCDKILESVAKDDFDLFEGCLLPHVPRWRKKESWSKVHDICQKIKVLERQFLFPCPNLKKFRLLDRKMMFPVDKRMAVSLRVQYPNASPDKSTQQIYVVMIQEDKHCFLWEVIMGETPDKTKEKDRK